MQAVRMSVGDTIRRNGESWSLIAIREKYAEISVNQCRGLMGVGESFDGKGTLTALSDNEIELSFVETPKQGLDILTNDLVLVDVEATHDTPMRGVMMEFAAIRFDGSYFKGSLYPFTPHPDNSIIPVVATDAQPEPFFVSDQFPAGTSLSTLYDLFAAFDQWLTDGHDRAVFVSDNPAFDFMWIACGFSEHGIDNPFGYSARRIGDFYAGLRRDWRETQTWKRHRITKHTHDPLDDVRGNLEALRFLLTPGNVPPKKVAVL